jgi:hypothetical protein
LVKLPDWQDLGEVPRLDARVPIARPDASPIARGAEQLGQGIARLGQGVGQFTLAKAQYQNALARGNLEADIIGLKQQYVQDADYSSLPQRFDADLQKLTQQQAETVDDASMRERFLSDAGNINAGHRARGDQQAFAIGKDAQKAYLDQAGQNFINAAGNSEDDAAHQRMIEAMNAAIDRAENLGILSRQEAMQRRAAFTDQYLSVDTSSQIDRAIAAGDAEKLDQIVAGLRVSRDRTSRASANGGAGERQGQQAADAAQADVALGEPGGHFDMLSPATREHLINYATQQQQAAVIDQQRGVAQQQAQIQQASDQREDQILQDTTGPSPQATAQSIAGDPALTPQASERIIAFLGRHETVSSQASHVAAAGLLARMRPGYEGTDKIGDLGPLYDAAIGDKINTADFNFLRDELVAPSSGYTSRLCSTAASTKEENSGCGSNGRDFSSGWNCTPMNHGWSACSMISGNTPSGDMPENRTPCCSSRPW